MMGWAARKEQREAPAPTAAERIMAAQKRVSILAASYRRLDGRAAVVMHGNLVRAAMELQRLEWHKSPRGRFAHGTRRSRLRIIE